MITLFVNGKSLGPWAEAEKLFTDSAASQSVEFRDSNGRVIATSVPGPEIDEDPDWVKAITPEETARRLAGEFVTFEELKERLGWK